MVVPIVPLPPMSPSRHSPQIGPLARTDAPILPAHWRKLISIQYFYGLSNWSYWSNGIVVWVRWVRVSLLCLFFSLTDWEKSWKRIVVCVSASRQHVSALPFGRKCMREDERHVKVPGFWRSIHLPIRPEITWPDLTLPVCLSMKDSEKEERTVRQGESVRGKKWNWMREREGHGTCQWNRTTVCYEGLNLWTVHICLYVCFRSLTIAVSLSAARKNVSGWLSFVAYTVKLWIITVSVPRTYCVN